MVEFEETGGPWVDVWLYKETTGLKHDGLAMMLL